MDNFWHTKRKIFWTVSLVLKLLIYSSPAIAVFVVNLPTKFDVVIQSTKAAFYHHDFIKFEAQVENEDVLSQMKEHDCYVVIEENRKDDMQASIVAGVGDKTFIKMKLNNKTQKLEGRFPCPWNLKEGKYKPSLWIAPNENGFLDLKVKSKKFAVVRRKPEKGKNEQLKIITFENLRPFLGLSVPDMSGSAERRDYLHLIDWAKELGANTFWHLASSTDYSLRKVDEDFPWVKYNLPMIELLGKASHKQNLKFGSWVIAYLTNGKEELAPKRYKYAWEYNSEEDVMFKTRAISIGDENRIKDIIAILKKLDQIKEIDYLGLDYIRNALGGYELVDEFVEEMDIRTLPDDWKVLSFDERMKWLAREKIKREDMNLIYQWYWFRAHKVAKIVECVKKEISKPLWVFTLTWEKGWQHGQDPVMMNDAGADIDALMLYEANNSQFNSLMSSWNRYIKKGDVNIVCGNVIDWVLHQKTTNPAGPEEFFNRYKVSLNNIYNNTKANGLFIHDLGRLLWGRRGPYKRSEWFFVCAAVFTLLDTINKVNHIDLDIDCEEEIEMGKSFDVNFNYKINGVHNISDIKIKPVVFPNDYVSINKKNNSRNTYSVKFSQPYDPEKSDLYSERGHRVMLGVKVTYTLKGEEKNDFHIKYINVSGGNSSDGIYKIIQSQIGTNLVVK
ncbi:hypothetical protein ACFL4A_02900 [bacterium]